LSKEISFLNSPSSSVGGYNSVFPKTGQFVPDCRIPAHYALSVQP
jgi:hypothetical protein